MPTSKSQTLPLVALLLTGITAFLAENHLPYTHSFVVYRYTVAIVLIFAFFRFIMFADKRRAAQLDDIGLLYPLHDGAFFICIHAHLRALGIELGWLSPAVSIEWGLLSWACILIGRYAPQQPNGLPNRLLLQIPFINANNKHTFCKHLIFAGALGVFGTFTATAQIVWLLLPLAPILWQAYRTQL